MNPSDPTFLPPTYPKTTTILHERETYAIRGAIFEVYREMGCGFLEAVYQECLEKEFAKANIPFAAQSELRLSYKGEPLKHYYRPDFICYNSVILEIKALSQTTGEHKAQLLNYLKSTGLKVGLLANFGCHPKATIERLLL
ncbi:GxxExxY protein [Myxococcota bacterium]|nr:GxxExxY protein [Myxococcota bacterium]